MDVPDFLQTKQGLPSSRLYDLKQILFGDRKKKLGFFVLLFLIVAIPLTVWIAQRTQIFSPKAGSGPIELVTGTDSCVISGDTNQVSCASFPIRLTSPLGPKPVESSPSPSPAIASPSPSISPSPSPFPSQSPSPSPSPSVALTACVPAPNNIRPDGVQITGGLKVTRTAGTNVNTPNNKFSIVKFTKFTNARVDIIGRTITSPVDIDIRVGTGCTESFCPDIAAQPVSSFDFNLYPVVQGQSATVEFTIVDSCFNQREWTDLAGGGPSVFGAGTPPSPISTNESNSGGNFNFSALIPDFFEIFKLDEAKAQITTALSSGLVSWWRFDEASGSDVADTKGVSNGTASNTQIIDGKVNKAREIATATSGVVVADNPAYANSNFTVAGWIKPNSFGVGNFVSIFSRRNVANTQGLTLEYAGYQDAGNGQLQCVVFLNEGTPGNEVRVANTAPNKLTVGQWSHVACSYDGAKVKVYINGILAGETAKAGTMRNGSGMEIKVGQNPFHPTNALNGAVDELAYWNRALTQGEITSLASGILPEGESTASPSPSAQASPSSSPTLPNTASCVSNSLALSTPFIVENTAEAGTILVYWNQTVSRDSFIAKVQECGATLLKPGNFKDAEVKSLIQSVTGAPSSSSDNSKYRNAIVEGPCTATKVNSYSSAGHSMLTDSQCDETGLDYKVNQYYGPGSGANPFGVYSGVADGGAQGFPILIAPTSSSSPSPTVSPTPSGELPGTNFYKLAETESGLGSALLIPYEEHPRITDFTFSNNTPGIKQIWAEFIGPDNISRKEHISVELIEPDPQITSLDCSMDISKQNLKLTLNGSRLGSSGGKVVVDGSEAQITTWNSNQVTATIKPNVSLEDGKTFKVKLTKNDNREMPELTCQVNTTLISLGARLICREPGKFDVSGVKVTLVDENGNKVNEEVIIDVNGVIQGLKTKLQVGKAYSISVKAPFSTRTNAEFTAANGTNVVTPDEGSIFILPTGDVAPVVLPDGKINTLDRSEIVRQWAVLGSTNKSADFNKDSRVNSIDWACMRYDFNREDEPIPDRATGAPSGSSPVPSPSLVPSASVTASSSPTPQASASSIPQERSAFFLLEPVAGGSYANGTQFAVNVNVWSQQVSANLFVGKLSFDPAALEVVRIEKGTVLTSWAEEFFDNQTGRISLVAGKPNPGLKTVEGDDPLMARIIFKAKKVGTTDVTVTNESRIFSNDDNANILSSLLSSQIAITN